MRNININENSKKIRKERRIKLKRIFNYDAEMNFIKSFWNLKKKELNLAEFSELAKKTLIDTEQISLSILEFFIEEEHIRIKIDELTTEKNEIEKKLINIKDEIYKLKEILEEDDDDKKTKPSVYWTNLNFDKT